MQARLSSRNHCTTSLLTLLVMLGACTGFTASHASEASPAPAAPTAASRPNILIFLTDDQRSGTMDVMPSTLQRFGEEGTTFAHAFATTPLCCPSRASIFSGRYAHNHTVQSNQHGAEKDFDEGTTMQASLQGAGYRTGIFGKYFNAWDLSEDPAFFDRWAIESPNGYTGYYGGTWNVNGTLHTVDRYSTDYIADRGMRFIRSGEGHDDQPWFLELAPYGVHMPAFAPPKYRAAPLPPFELDPSMREQDLGDKPPYVRNRDRERLVTILTTRDRQLRALMSVDDMVQRVFETLEASGELGNTLAFFLGDNGMLWGAHGIKGKQTPYTASIRVPMFARWTGHIDAGAVDHRFVANIDIAPTVLAAAGVQPAAVMDGRSLFDSWTRDRMLLEYWRLKHPSDVPTWASIRTRSYQYIEYYSGDGNVTFREYYDLAQDPWELTNLLHDGTPRNDPSIRPFAAELAALRTCMGAACP